MLYPQPLRLLSLLQRLCQCRAVVPAPLTVPHFSFGMWSFVAPLCSSLGLAMMTAHSVSPRFGPSNSPVSRQTLALSFDGAVSFLAETLRLILPDLLPLI